MNFQKINELIRQDELSLMDGDLAELLGAEVQMGEVVYDGEDSQVSFSALVVKDGRVYPIDVEGVVRKFEAYGDGAGEMRVPETIDVTDVKLSERAFELIYDYVNDQTPFGRMHSSNEHFEEVALGLGEYALPGQKQVFRSALKLPQETRVESLNNFLVDVWAANERYEDYKLIRSSIESSEDLGVTCKLLGVKHKSYKLSDKGSRLEYRMRLKSPDEGSKEFIIAISDDRRLLSARTTEVTNTFFEDTQLEFGGFAKTVSTLKSGEFVTLVGAKAWSEELTPKNVESLVDNVYGAVGHVLFQELSPELDQIFGK